MNFATVVKVIEGEEPLLSVAVFKGHFTFQILLAYSRFGLSFDFTLSFSCPLVFV